VLSPASSSDFVLNKSASVLGMLWSEQ